MTTFNRGLSDEFVAAFNKKYDEGDWLKTYVDDSDVFLAIRDESVNFYYRGCSLLKLDRKDDALIGEIHYKYLLRPNLRKPYARVVDGTTDLPDDAGNLFMRHIDNVGDLKKAAEPYAGNEKTGVHDILIANHNILDVEIAFGIAGNEESDPSASRIDFAAIRESGEGAEIGFFEAKHFDNISELRAAGEAKEPKVVEQIKRYSNEIRTNRAAIIESYRQVCGNLRSLRGMAERHPARHAMLGGVADGSRKLRVDENPTLVVFGFDADQRGGKNWYPHREKLKQMLNGNVYFKGDTKEFVRGISV